MQALRLGHAVTTFAEHDLFHFEEHVEPLEAAGLGIVYHSIHTFLPFVWIYRLTISLVSFDER